MADDKKIIFSMVGVSKSFQNNKQVLKNFDENHCRYREKLSG